MTIKHDEAAVTQRAVPGPALYAVTTLPDDAPKAIVGLLHGYADHAARYAHVMDAWAAKGIATVAIDMRGHGRAAGPRGYCARFDEFLDDASELARLVADKGHGAPAFLFGHSFGGLVAASSAIASPGSWKGVVLSSPYFGLALEVPGAKLIAAKIASRLVPRLALPTGIRGSAVTHDPVRAAAYESDPLVFKNATARWFTETVRAQKNAFARASSLTLPLLVVAAGADAVAKTADAHRFFDAVGSKDKTWDERKGLFHETLNEPEWPEIADEIAAWVLDRAK
jgi:alpha-beta hydrolase superfamily lysophospholipase